MMAKHKLVYPPPKYVGTFASGEVVRLTVHWRAGKPFDYEAARRGLCQVIGNERGRAAFLTQPRTPQLARYLNTLVCKKGVVRVRAIRCAPRDLCYMVFPPAADLIDGRMEHDGTVYRDPAFAPAAVEEPKPDQAVTRVIAAINKFNWSQLEAVQAAIDERLAAA